MGFGILSPEQCSVVSKHISGKVVHDIGAGDLSLSHKLLKLGALRVVAVDKEQPRVGHNVDPRIEIVQSLFHEYLEPIDIAFYSWPVTNDESWWPMSFKPQPTLIVARARVVLYLGKCTDGTACGSMTFWRNAKSRPVLDYVPHRSNTLIAYGDGYRDPLAAPLPEEVAALSPIIISYDDLEPEGTPAAP